MRAAHAYMLISIPTGTSTIFGAFQVIFHFSNVAAHLLSKAKVRPSSERRKLVFDVRCTDTSARMTWAAFHKFGVGASPLCAAEYYVDI